MQTTIELPQDHLNELEELSRRERRPISEVIQDAVAAHLERRRKPDAPAHITDPVLRESFGAWRGLIEEDGLDYQRRLRAEWDREWDR